MTPALMRRCPTTSQFYSGCLTIRLLSPAARPHACCRTTCMHTAAGHELGSGEHVAATITWNTEGSPAARTSYPDKCGALGGGGCAVWCLAHIYQPCRRHSSTGKRHSTSIPLTSTIATHDNGRTDCMTWASKHIQQTHSRHLRNRQATQYKPTGKQHSSSKVLNRLTDTHNVAELAKKTPHT